MVTRTPRRRASELGMRLLFGCAGVLIAACILEFTLRISGYHRQFAQYDADTGYVLTAHFERVVPIPEYSDTGLVTRTNNLGLRRDTDISRDKPNGHWRLLVVGDSQSEGLVPNADTYSTQLERLLRSDAALRAATPPEIEVLNGAVSGYSPLLEYVWLLHRGAQLQPDRILLALYAGNDVAELLMQHTDFAGFGPAFKIPFLQRSGQGWQVIKPGYDRGVLGRADWLLTTDFRLYAMLHRVLARPPEPTDAPLAHIVRQCFGCTQSVAQAYIAHTEPAQFDEAFAKLDYLVEQCLVESDRLHAPLLIAVIPTKVEVEGNAVVDPISATITSLGLRYDAAGFDAHIRERMLATAQRHTPHVVDLFPPLRAAFERDGRALFWNLDWHLNVNGNRVIAEYLAPTISEWVRSTAPNGSRGAATP